MKLTHNTKKNKGMTLLELTVVILVLLSLISILFIGARAWKQGSDRAGCIMNIRNVQQAVRSHGNMQGLNPGDTIVAADVIGAGKFIETAPDCPDATGGYTMAAPTEIPAVGTLYMECSLGTYAAGVGTGHAPSSYTGW